MSDLQQTGAVLVFCAGFVFLLWGLSYIWRTTRIRRSGGVASGTVVSSRAGREDTYITVRFLTAHNHDIRFEQLAPLFHKQQCKVFYDVAHPQRATVSPWRDMIAGLILAGFGVFFISETRAAVLAILM